MINPKELGLRALSAVEVLRRGIDAACEIFPGAKAGWTIETNVGGFNGSAQTDRAATEAALAELKALADTKPYLVVVNLTVKRQGDPAEQFKYSSPDGIRASIEIKSSGPPRTVEMVDALSRHFDFAAITDLFQGGDPESAELTALRLREASVADLHAQLEKLGSLLTTITERDVELRTKRMAELDADDQTRRRNFETERTSALERDEQQRQARQEGLQQQEAKLRADIAAFETRESKYVRRDIEKEMKKVLEDFGTLTLSDGTRKKRWPVTAAVLVMASMFVGLAIVAGYNYFTTLDLHYLPASTAGLLGFSATMLFYVKWSDRWFREHADEELQSKRYKADMLRASWLAELVGEWVKEGKEAPPEMLQVFARNLFANAPNLGETEHPADALLGLLKRAQKIDVGKDRVTLEAGSPK